MGFTDRVLSRDQCGYYGNVYYGDCNGGWYHWGRWVLAGVALLLFVLVLMFLCLQARRRRKHGSRPFYGTGWMAPPGKLGVPGDNYGMNTYQQSAGQTYNPPPAYGQSQHQPQYMGTTGEAAEYYGNQQYQPGLMSPPNAYQRDNVYPPGPPGQK